MTSIEVHIYDILSFLSKFVFDCFQSGKQVSKPMPNRKSLEFIHAALLTKRVDFDTVKLPAGVLKLIHRFVFLKWSLNDK